MDWSLWQPFRYTEHTCLAVPSPVPSAVMSGAGEEADKGLSSYEGFVRDFARSAAVWRRDPRLPLTVIAVILVQQVWSLLGEIADSGWLYVVWLVPFIGLVGFYGTERIWYVASERGTPLTWADIVEHTRELFGRFFGLGFLVTCWTFIPSLILGIATNPEDDLMRVLIILAIWVPLDVVLTFATVVLAFKDIRPIDSVRHSIEVLRAEWPRCAWHALVPPFAVTVAFQVLPRDTLGPVARLIAVIAIELFALLCKGAIVFFYADRYSTFGGPDELRDLP
jgi:hypothetical protein